MMTEPVTTKLRGTGSKRAERPNGGVVSLPDGGIRRRMVQVKANAAAEHVGAGDIAVIERRTVARRTLSRLVEDLAARGAAALVIHRELAECLSAGEREALEAQIPLLVADAEWDSVSGTLLSEIPARRDLRPDAALRAILRGEPGAGPLPSTLDSERALRAVAIIAHPDDRAPLPISKLQEVVETEALLGDPRAHAVTVDGVVVAITGNYVHGNEIDGLGRAILHRASSALLLSSATVGIGRAYAGASGLRRGYREALWAAEVSESLWGGGRVMTFRELGIFGMLEPFVRDPSTGDTEDIEQLLEYDRKNHTALLPTMEAFFEAGRSGDAASALFVHRNTISYRLRAVQRITGLDALGDADARLLLEVQLKLARLRGLLPLASEQPSNGKRRSRSS